MKELPPSNTNKTLPKTGEGTNISLYAWLMLTSGALLVLIGYRRRNHAK
ncbi:TPA: LPXTG cell wall anchor domain-containing protein [Streptococcus pneumoniae]